MSLFARRRARRGASAIEFGLSLPVLLLICSAVIEYGMIFFHQSALIGAVRDGTRYGATVLVVDGPDTEAASRAREVLEGYGLSCGNAQTCAVSAQVLFDGVNEFWYLDVTIDREYQPIMGDILPVPNEVHAHMAMLIEDQLIQ